MSIRVAKRTVTTDVSRWFKRAQPPNSGVSPMRLREVALTCEVGGRSPRPRPPVGRCPVLTHVVTSFRPETWNGEPSPCDETFEVLRTLISTYGKAGPAIRALAEHPGPD